MSPAAATSYDLVPYPSNSYSQTHPDRLAMLATLFGLDPPDVTRCRVLELGCGAGSNLIPMAYGLPGSRFVGVDLAASAVARGRELVAALGLANVELRHADLMGLGPDLGEFDYIIAHGLYSWVPPAVRDRLLALCGDRLADNGVAFVSYKVYPGGHVTDMVRSMMLFHVGAETDPPRRIAAARGLLRLLTDGMPAETHYQRILRQEAELIGARGDGGLYHDELEEVSAPVYFHAFADHAARHGLQFLAEADHSAVYGQGYAPETVAALDALPGGAAAREQYLDFLGCRRFRQTLLCRSGRAIDRPPRPARLRALRVACGCRPVAPLSPLDSATKESFRTIAGGEVATDAPLAKAALVALGEAFPRSLRFDDLAAAAAARLPDRAADPDALADFLLRAFHPQMVQLHVHEPPLAAVAGAYPVASGLARHQLARGERATNLRHRTIEIEDPGGRALVGLLDGTRDRPALVEAMARQVESGAVALDRNGAPVVDPAAIRRVFAAELDGHLAGLARLELLMA